MHQGRSSVMMIYIYIYIHTKTHINIHLFTSLYVFIELLLFYYYLCYIIKWKIIYCYTALYVCIELCINFAILGCLWSFTQTAYIYIYIYICVRVCVCVCVWIWEFVCVCVCWGIVCVQIDTCVDQWRDHVNAIDFLYQKVALTGKWKVSSVGTVKTNFFIPSLRSYVLKFYKIFTSE